MQIRTLAVVAAVAALIAAAPATPAGAATTDVSPQALVVAHQTLAAKDGWASSGTGTTGGSAADDTHITVVHNRSELVQALGGDNTKNATNSTSKIIFVDGIIEGNADDNNTTLSCASYQAPGYDFAAFLKKYDPAVWDKTKKPDAATDPLEAARVASAKNQAARVMLYVGSNTTIVGLNGAGFTHANLMISGVSNVIVRNLTFTDAKDCFPVWDPTDTDVGNWNSAYDTLSVIGSTNVWIDHNDFSDGTNLDANQPTYLGRPFQVHDGLLDITKKADLVTVSANYLHDHDKTMLIGSSDTSTTDVGKLRVTVHHNLFKNLGQRVPRVRFGQVDVYNNHYITGPKADYLYSWGVGTSAAIYAEKNFFDVSSAIALDSLVYDWRKTGLTPGTITELGSMVHTGDARPTQVSLVDKFNATHTPTLGPVVGWTPDLRATTLTKAADVPTVVDHTAGVGHLWAQTTPTTSASTSASSVSLPVTGAQTALAAGIGVGLLALGGLLFLISRRRRIVFTTQDTSGS